MTMGIRFFVSADFPADIQSVDFGEHEVEDDECVVFAQRHVQTRCPVLSSVESVADVFQMDLDQVCNVGVVFDDEDGLGHGKQGLSRSTQGSFRQ